MTSTLLNPNSRQSGQLLTLSSGAAGLLRASLDQVTARFQIWRDVFGDTFHEDIETILEVEEDGSNFNVGADVLMASAVFDLIAPYHVDACSRLPQLLASIMSTATRMSSKVHQRDAAAVKSHCRELYDSCGHLIKLCRSVHRWLGSGATEFKVAIKHESDDSDARRVDARPCARPVSQFEDSGVTLPPLGGLILFREEPEPEGT